MIAWNRTLAPIALAALLAGPEAAAQTDLPAATGMLVDAFQANCLATLGDAAALRAAAARRAYPPVPPERLEELNAGEAWIVPGRYGDVVLGLSPSGACGTSTRQADPALAARLLARRLVLRPLAEDPRPGRAYRVELRGQAPDHRRGQAATLRIRGFSGRHQGAVALTLALETPVAAMPDRAPAGALPPTLPALPGQPGDSAVAGNLPLPPLERPQAPVAGVGPPAGVGAGRPREPAWDPGATSLENLAANMFDDVCVRTGNDGRAIERKARAFGWTEIDREATIRAGFDRGWEMRSPGGGTLMVFFDPLGPKCCVSAFPARPRVLAAAVATRHGLGQPREHRAGRKRVLTYRPRGDHRITLDFEDIDPRGTFASVCYARR